MRLRVPLLVALALLALSACDAVEVEPPVDPPVEPPPAQPVHPYGAGNGKVVFLSDLAVAQRIDVTLGGEVVGAITKFVGCPGRVTVDDSLATTIRPAGTYQYSARSTTGLSWASSSVSIAEDGLKRITFVGRPSQYAIHVPDQIEGLPVSNASGDTFQFTTTSSTGVRLKVTKPVAVQGDRIDVVSNGTVLASRVPLATEDLWFNVPLSPGPNYIAVRLSVDPGDDGADVDAYLYDGETYLGALYNYQTYLRPTRWYGGNIRYVC